MTGWVLRYKVWIRGWGIGVTDWIPVWRNCHLIDNMVSMKKQVNVALCGRRLGRVGGGFTGRRPDAGDNPDDVLYADGVYYADHNDAPLCPVCARRSSKLYKTIGRLLGSGV